MPNRTGIEFQHLDSIGNQVKRSRQGTEGSLMLQLEGIRAGGPHGHVLGEKTLLVEQIGYDSAVLVIGQRSAHSIRHRQSGVVHQAPGGSIRGEARLRKAWTDPSFGMACLTVGFPDRGT